LWNAARQKLIKRGDYPSLGGNLDQAKANLAFAEADLQRALSVAIGAVISQQMLDQRTQARRVAQASVAAQEQAVRQASLDLEFTELRAPVDGRIGDRRVSVGNLVTGGAAGTTRGVLRACGHAPHGRARRMARRSDRPRRETD